MSAAATGKATSPVALSRQRRRRRIMSWAAGGSGTLYSCGRRRRAAVTQPTPAEGLPVVATGPPCSGEPATRHASLSFRRRGTWGKSPWECFVPSTACWPRVEQQVPLLLNVTRKTDCLFWVHRLPPTSASSLSPAGRNFIILFPLCRTPTTLGGRTMLAAEVVLTTVRLRMHLLPTK